MYCLYNYCDSTYIHSEDKQRIKDWLKCSVHSTHTKTVVPKLDHIFRIDIAVVLLLKLFTHLLLMLLFKLSLLS